MGVHTVVSEEPKASRIFSSVCASIFSSHARHTGTPFTNRLVSAPQLKHFAMTLSPYRRQLITYWSRINSRSNFPNPVRARKNLMGGKSRKETTSMPHTVVITDFLPNRADTTQEA